MRKLGMAICFLASLMVVASCSGETIIGSWQHDSQNVVYTFNEDNTFSISVNQGSTVREGTYELDSENNTIVLTIPSGLTQTGEYKFEGKQLIITSPDSGGVTTMTRIKTK